MNTHQVYEALRKASTLEYLLENTYIFNWESDLFGVTKSGYSTEIEVKSSRADFLADFKKVDKHEMLKMAYAKKKIYTKRLNLYYTYEYVWQERGETRFRANQQTITQELEPPKLEHQRNQKMIHTSISFKKVFAPNKFWYACPEGMVKAEEVPDYAGLYWLDGKNIVCIKKAPFLHKTKHEFTAILLHKFYHKCLNLEIDNQNLKKHLDFINEKCLSGNVEFKPEGYNNQIIF